MLHGKLVGREVIPCSADEALPQWDNNFNRHVGKDTIGDQLVSTVFLVLDHGFGNESPRWFETMVFGGQDDEYCERYETYDQAEEGHRRIVEALLSGRRLSVTESGEP